MQHQPADTLDRIIPSSAVAQFGAKKTNFGAQKSRNQQPPPSSIRNWNRSSSADPSLSSSDNEASYSYSDDDDDNGVNDPRSTRGQAMGYLASAGTPTAPQQQQQQLVYNHFNEPPRSSNQARFQGRFNFSIDTSDRGQHMTPKTEVNPIASGHLWSRRPQELTTNIDDDDDEEEEEDYDDDGPIRNDLDRHVTSASSGFRSEESPKKRKKKSRSKDVDRRRNHGDQHGGGTLDGSSDGYYSKIKDNGPSLIPNIPPPPQEGTPNVPPPRKVKGVTVQTPPSIAASQTLERSRATNSKRGANNNCAAANSTATGPSLDHYLQQQQQQQQQQQVIPTFPRTVPRTISFPRDSQGRVTTSDAQPPHGVHGNQQQLGLLSNQQLGLLGNHGVLSNNSTGMAFENQQQQFNSRVFPVVTYQCRTKSPDSPPSERINRQTKDADDDFSKYIDHSNYSSQSTQLPPNHPQAFTTQPLPPPPTSTNFNNRSRFGSTSYQVTKVKKHLSCKKTWKCAALILACMAVVFMSIIVYFITIKINDTENGRTKIAQDGSSQDFLSHDNNILFGLPPGSSSSLSASTHETYTYGKTLTRTMEGGTFLRLTLFQPESQPVKFNVTIPKGHYLGVYGRRGAPPSHVLYDFFRVIDGDQVYLNDRMGDQALSSKSSQKRSSLSYSIKDSIFLEYVERGTWYLALYNDSPNNLLVNFHAVWQDKPTGKCPFNCHGRGECVGQKCTCFPGYTGLSCNDSLCPALCMGNGVYQGGRCKCFRGWTGLECQKPITACVEGGCGQKGRCVKGECICEQGYSGVDCSEEICQEECVNGYCEDRSCVCQEGWTGQRCDSMPCSERCHHHGNCNNGSCICMPGWNGRHCSLDGCPKDCSNHGSCQQVDGKFWTCICSLNWKGDACDLPVEIQCGNNLDDDGDGLTDCHDSECCLTRECQENNFCKTVPNPIEILLRSNGPVSTAPFFDRVRFLIDDKSVQSYATPSIFNHTHVSVIRGKVLTPDGSPVIGVRVGVDGQPQFGHTLTRERGLFDIVVNGGGSVTLDLQRMPFNSKRVTVTVPWNRMITIDDIELRPSDVISVSQALPVGHFNGDLITCPHVFHDYVNLKPTIFSSSRNSHLVVECSDNSAIFPETQTVQETIEIPHTSTHLVYQSSDAVDYMATVMILLTSWEIPTQLTFVHLTVKVEGIVFKKTFEGNSNLKYRFAWNRRNAYNEKVYGVVKVTVSVGYEHEDCDHIFWTTQLTTMNGYSLSSANIGGWKLNIHHAYHSQEGTVYKGDGGIIRLRERPLEIKTILGDRRQRKADCRGCDGKTEDNRLMAPVDLAAGRDGSLYVGDYNFIRKLSSNREEITSILQLSMPEVPYKYFMTVSPVDGQLYLSDHRNYRIIRVKSQGQVKDLMTNFELVAGTGEQCIPGDRERCGDNGPASNAKLFYPKGIAINKDGVIYIADGSNIRMVDMTGIIRTIIGSQAPPKHWDPFPCGKISFASNVMLQWPLSLAINPVDDTLHILDNNVILKLTSDGRVYLVAGHLSHCPMANETTTNHRFRISHHANDRLTLSHHHHHLADDKTRDSDIDVSKNGRKTSAEKTKSKPADIFHEWRSGADSPLDHPHHIAISPDGDIYVVENDGKRTNRIIMIDTSGKLHRIAGASSDHCDCRLDDCRCFDPKATVATKALLDTPTSVAVTPDGVVHVADMANLQVRSIYHRLPTQDRYGQVSVTDSDLTYIFNRYGQHISTINAITDRPVYTFTPDIISSLGKLVKVSDTQGNQMELKKELCSKEICHMEIVVSGRYKNKLIFNAMGQLYAFVCQEDNSTKRFYYSAATELLHSAESSDGTTKLYEYNNIGRLASFVLPTGLKKTLRTDLISDDLSAGHGGVLVEVINEKGAVEDGYLFAQDKLSLFAGSKYLRTVEQRGDKDEASLKMSRGTTLTLTSDLQGKDKVVRRIVELPDNRTFESEWQISMRQDSGQRNVKKLKISGETALQLEFDHSSQTETIFNRNQDRIIHLQYDRYGRVVHLQPAGPLEGVNISYNTLTNRLASWSRGDLSLVNIYDEKFGLLLESQAGNKVYRRYSYETSNKPTDVTLPSGKQYQLRYDDIGNLRGVVTPSLNHHAFHSLHSFTLYRQILKPSTVSTGVYTRNFDSNGRPLSVSYPSNHRRLTHHYSRHGNRVSVFVDWADQVYDFDPHFRGLLRWANLTDRVGPGYHCAVGYSSEDALVTSQVVIQWGSTMDSIANATYFYSYDNRARLSHTDVVLGDRPMRRYAAVERSDDTGAVTRLHSFSIDQPGPHRQTLRDLNVEIAREFDRLGRLSDVWYRFNTHSIYHLEAKYDQTTGRLLQWRRKVGSSDTKVYDNLYDSDGNLIEVLLSGQLAWKYDYDADGNIVKITYYGTSHSIVYNSRDQIENSGTKSYVFDQDGFLSQRDRETFEFDSFGRLKRASKSGEYDARYYFDARHRLVVRHELLLDDIVQFFYADLEHPTRVTHTLENNNYGRAHASNIGSNNRRTGREGEINQTPLQLSEFYYDDREELFAIRRGDNDHYYVANDVHGSPVVVLNGLGRVMKQLEHDPLGVRKWDSVRNFSLHIGFRGGLHDPFTGFVLFEAGAKVYDPEVGRWAVPDYARFLDNYQYLLRQPEHWANLYTSKFRNERNDLATLDVDESSLSDITKWLSQLGYDYPGIITPSSRFTQPWAFQLPRGISAIVGNSGFQYCDDSKASSFCLEECPQRTLVLRTALDCAFDRELTRFTSLLSSTNSKLSPPPISNKFERLRLSPLPPLLGRGIMITTEDPLQGAHTGMVGVTTLKPAHEALSLLASTLLNDSILVLPRYNIHSIDVHHFIKTSFQQAEDDILELALRPEGTIQGLNVSVHKNTESNHVEIRLRGNHTVFYLRYGIQVAEERDHVLKHAKTRALEGAWAIERELAQLGKLSANDWTRIQKEEILVKGRVDDCQAKYIRNIAIYPELADDPKNVAFVQIKATQEN